MLTLTFAIAQKKGRAKKQRVKKGKLSLPQCIDLTGPKSVAHSTLKGMNQKNVNAVNTKIGKTIKAKLNQGVKDAILDVAHREELEKLNCHHRTQSVISVAEMVHKPTQ
jgi:hypothetical protein